MFFFYYFLSGLIVSSSAFDLQLVSSTCLRSIALLLIHYLLCCRNLVGIPLFGRSLYAFRCFGVTLVLVFISLHSLHYMLPCNQYDSLKYKQVLNMSINTMLHFRFFGYFDTINYLASVMLFVYL